MATGMKPVHTRLAINKALAAGLAIKEVIRVIPYSASRSTIPIRASNRFIFLILVSFSLFSSIISLLFIHIVSLLTVYTAVSDVLFIGKLEYMLKSTLLRGYTTWILAGKYIIYCFRKARMNLILDNTVHYDIYCNAVAKDG